MTFHCSELRLSIRKACWCFAVSQGCYRYQPKLSPENELISEWLIQLTSNQRNWGFGLCFLYLRNVKGFGWNHKRVYRIYCELELNMRIKPKKRIVREQPESLTIPEKINESWSMDFMHDQLADGRSVRLLNVNDDFNRALQDLTHVVYAERLRCQERKTQLADLLKALLQ